MDWAFVHKIWEKWASNHVDSSGQPLKAALLINYDPTGPSRLLSTIAEQEGIKANPIELRQFVDFVKRNKLRSESFCIGLNQYIVTSIHENGFCARCINSTKPSGEGAIVIETAAFLLVALLYWLGISCYGGGRSVCMAVRPKKPLTSDVACAMVIRQNLTTRVEINFSQNF